MKFEQNILKDIEVLKNDLLLEIANQSYSPNTAKKGCVLRLDNILKKYKEEDIVVISKDRYERLLDVENMYRGLI